MIDLRPQSAQRSDTSQGGIRQGGTRQRGQAGEDAAVRYLEAHGYSMVERNWRPGKGASGALRGEVDCIAWHGKTLCFI